MIFNVVVGLATLGFLYWIWQVLPHRVDDWEYKSTYDERGIYSGTARVVTGKRWELYFETWWTGVLGILCIIAVWVLAVAFISLVFMGFMNIAIKDYKLDSETNSKLVALGTDSAVNGKIVGSIFLTAGYMSEDPTFKFLYETEDSGVKMGQVGTDNAVVYEDEEKRPYYTEFNWVKSDEFWAPFLIDTSETYTFHVPKGSVVSDYEVKL